MKRTLLTILSMVLCLSMQAAVTLDFTNAANDWGIPSGSSNGLKGPETYTNGTYSITLCAADAFYFNTSGYLMLGKSGSYLTLPTVDFAVGTIVVGGKANASSNTVMNIYVDDTAVSTACTGSAEDHTYVIDSNYQTVGTTYTFKITNAYNAQITSITLYAVGEDVGSDQPSGHGYEPDDPYTVSELIPVIEALSSGGTVSGVYVKGIVSQIDEISVSYGNMTYYISDDGTTTNQLEIYRGKSLNNAGPTTDSDIKVSDVVVVYGTFVNYNGTTPEGQTGNTYIYSLNGETESPEEEHNGEVDIEGTTVELINPDVSVGAVTTSADFTTMGLSNGVSLDGTSLSFTDGSTVTFAKGSGSTNPAWYDNNSSIRVYADNTLTFSCERAIAMIEIHCYSTSYEGNQDYEYVEFSEDGKTAVYCNLWTGTSGGTNLYVQSITITYAAEDGDQIDPQLAYSFTSVTCDTSNYEDAELPELTYAEDFDGVDEITYSSSNEEVATVTEAGVVSILGVEGTASITASFPGNDTYFAETASFTITVEATHTFNFEVNNYGLTPISSSSEYDKDDVTLNGNDGVTLSLTVASGNGYRLWEGQDYNDLRLYSGVMMTITAPNPMTEISFYCESSYVNNMTSDVGEYSVVSTTGTWTGNATEVTFTMSGQMRIRTIDVTQETPTTGSFTITEAGYATYYTDYEYTMPEGVTGTTVTGVEDTAMTDGGYLLKTAWSYTAGTTVPAKTALVLKGEANTYTYAITSTEATAPTDNLLLGSTTDIETYGPDEGTTYLYYELTNGSSGIGFYYGEEGGVAFTSAANKAWLPLSESQARNAKFLGFDEGDTTGITSVENEAKTVKGIYTLQGVKVSNMSQPGLYIVDGKKVIKR